MPPPSIPKDTFLKIRQQNVNKSRKSQLDFMHRVDPSKFDILAIQEPYLDTRGNSRTNNCWYSVYPKNHFLDTSKTRSLLLVNKNIPTNSWNPIELDSSDISAILMKTPIGNLIIFNIYNDQSHSQSLRIINSYMRRQQRLRRTGDPPTHAIWLGDFNRHHPFWDEPRNAHLFTRSNLDDAQVLLDLIAEYDMHMTLPKHVPTLRAMRTGNLTRPDNVFTSSSLLDAVLSCAVLPDEQPTKTDHFPIDTVFNTSPGKTEDTPQPNFRATNWEDFHRTLEDKLKNLPTSENISNEDEFYARLHDLTNAIRHD